MIFFKDIQTEDFFKEEKMNSSLKLELFGDAERIWNQYGNNVNPIIKNLLIMDSRDFSSEET